MTHAEALNCPGHSLPRSQCGGELVNPQSYSVNHFQATGPATQTVVTVYTCARCGRRLSLERASADSDTWVPLNDYAMDLVSSLAQSFSLDKETL